METAKILITVKTYPVPSKRYGEIVCTAGVRENGEWIRLYPIDYRDRGYIEWYKKYQWIQVEIEKHKRDPRPESYRPTSKIKSLSKPLDTQNKWAERKKHVFKKGIYTMCWFNKQKQKDISLAVIKPGEIKDFLIEKTSSQWTPEQKSYLERLSLFETREKKILEKIPYKFSYHFKCEGIGCSGHTIMIEDWEAMELFRRMRDRYSEKESLNKVKERFLNTICSPAKDTYFFVGTVLKHGTKIIIGTFWPPF
jgi:hypothetical protein